MAIYVLSENLKHPYLATSSKPSRFFLVSRDLTAGPENLTFVQRKPLESREPKGAPTPLFVVLVSLFGYPGAGHLLLGRRQEAFFFGSLFTVASLGLLYEIWVILPALYSLLRQAVELQALTLATLPVPDLSRVGLWVLLSGGLWLVCGIHSGLSATQPPAKEKEEAAP